jgi:hypothetical protein
MLGFHQRESAELGLLLTAKGHFHVFLAVIGILVGSLLLTISILLRSSSVFAFSNEVDDWLLTMKLKFEIC